MHTGHIIAYPAKTQQILLDKVRILTGQKNDRAAVLLCEQGMEVSLKRNKGKDIPDLLYWKAICAFHLGKNADCLEILKQSYACYVLLGKRRRADAVRKIAKEMFRLEIEPLDVDIEFSDLWKDEPNRESEISEKCSGVGDLLRKLRKISGVKQKTIYTGICTSGNYSMIEQGKTEPGFFLLEAFMQRLGRDINRYTDTFLSKEEFYQKQKKQAAYTYLSLKKADEAEKIIKELETDKKFTTSVNEQFLLNVKASILREREGYSEEYFALLQDALRKTIPEFSEDRIESYCLTYEEISLINQYAGYIAHVHSRRRAAKIYEMLKASMDRSYFHEEEKVRTYTGILYNYSKELGMLERYEEALEIIEDGMRLCVKYQCLNFLPDFAVNKACDILEFGRREESLSYLKLAYYVYEALGEAENGEKVKAYVKEKFNIAI